jgi:protein-disulfide isomerase
MSRLFIPVGPADHHDGPLDAPVTLVEYGDYECPYCGDAYADLKAVKRAMGDGLCFVFRNFPLTQMHPHALHAAEFAERAAEAGRFWEAHDLLYENQQALGDRDLAGYALRLGLDPAAASEGGAGRLARIEADFSGGVRSGVNGTPSLFINGLRYDGPRDTRSLLSILTDLRRTG